MPDIETTKVPKKAELHVMLGQLVESMTLLTKRVEEIAEKQDKQEQKAAIPNQSVSVRVVNEVKTESVMQVPSDYRALVNTLLNQNFGIEITPRSDIPAFMFSIIVPPEYSSVSPTYLEMYKRDERPKVIPMAEGLNGVKMWVERVYSSFDNETKARISLDRVHV